MRTQHRGREKLPRLILALAALLYSSFGGAAAASQPSAPDAEHAAILAVVDRFMIAVSTNDAATLAALHYPGGSNVVERPAESDGAAAAGAKARGTVITRRVFNPDSLRTGTYRERYWDPIVHVRGSIAVVWTPYEFWRDGKTTHCGVDVFDMVKEQGAWLIANTMWTVEPDACPALRPKDPARVRPTP